MRRNASTAPGYDWIPTNPAGGQPSHPTLVRASLNSGSSASRRLVAAQPGRRLALSGRFQRRRCLRSQLPSTPGCADTQVRADYARFCNEIVIGNGGKQILLEDPPGNPIELFEPQRQALSRS